MVRDGPDLSGGRHTFVDLGSPCLDCGDHDDDSDIFVDVLEDCCKSVVSPTARARTDRPFASESDADRTELCGTPLVISRRVTLRPRIAARVRRGFAVLLTALILSPFTAPFSTCPLSLLTGDHRAPAATIFKSSAQDESPPSDAFSVQIEEKQKDEALVLASAEPSEVVIISIEKDRPVPTGVSVTPFVPLVLRV